jgi:hypothetical protein
MEMVRHSQLIHNQQRMDKQKLAHQIIMGGACYKMVLPEHVYRGVEVLK